MTLPQLAEYVRAHGFAATIAGRSVLVLIPWVNLDAGTEGLETVAVRTWGEARAALGY